MGENKHIPLVGDVKHYVGRSPWDFYSWGHIAMGIASFLLLSLMITITEYYIGPAIISWWMIMVFVLIIALVWEFIENVILYSWGWKFEKRRDSFLNFLWDVIFVAIGGLVMWLFKWIIMDLLAKRGTYFYIVGIISFGIILLAYFIGFFITNENTKKL